MSDDVGSEQGLERRRFLKGAATVAWAAPMILTMAARPAGAQVGASCLPNGGPCDACTGMNCCDADGPADGGCCCSDPNVPECGGVCTPADATCTAIPSPGNPGEFFTCYVPGPVTLSSVGRARSTGKGPKVLH
jgi:hypothetical protein